MKKPSFEPGFIGEIIIDEMKIKTSNTGHVFIYENGHYTLTNSIPKIRHKATVLLGGSYKKHKVEEIETYIKDRTFQDISPMNDTSLICFKNCIFELTTGLPLDFDSDHFITNQLPVKYNPDLDTTEWVEYVKTLVPDSEMVDTLQEFTGYALTPRQQAKKLLFIYGDRDSGKSTFFRILKEFYGTLNTSSLSLIQMCQRFTSAELYGKLVNIKADMEYKVKPSNIETIKSLTGDDTITAERKFGHPFQFMNRAKIFLSANGVPALPSDGVDDAFYKRWLPIEFPFKFTGQNKDVGIERKYTTPEMLSMILKWSLEGLDRLRKNNWVFTINPSVEQIKDWFLEGVIYNNVENFMVERCTWNPNEYVMKEELQMDNELWCKDKQIPALEPNAFHRKVKNNRVFSVEEFRPRSIDGSQVRAWRGIKLLSRRLSPIDENEPDSENTS